MKINSEKLYEFINNLGTSEKVKFKVYYDDTFTGAEVFWDGDNFIWESGKFSSGMFFYPLYSFEIIEKKPKKLDEIGLFDLTTQDSKDNEFKLNYTGVANTIEKIYSKVDELTKAVNYLLEKSDNDE